MKPLMGQDAAPSPWCALFHVVLKRCEDAGIHLSRMLVLLPHPQLASTAVRAWGEAFPSGFSPTFQSARQWAQSVAPFAPGPTDWTGDRALDSWVAARFLDSVAARPAAPELRTALIGQLLQVCRELAPRAASLPPSERTAWQRGWSDHSRASTPLAHWEALVCDLAVAWAASSSYATDVLWGQAAEPGTGFDGLCLLRGFLPDPLTEALFERWGERAHLLLWPEPNGAASRTQSQPRLHACLDAEDEAERAAACVIAHANTGRLPVALVATDRLLTRRISAMLRAAGLGVCDEHGWKLSTTKAGARLMSLLRAAQRQARTDDVLDWLKQVPGCTPEVLAQLESRARRVGVAEAASARVHPKLADLALNAWWAVLDTLRAPRSVVDWLPAVMAAIAACDWHTAFANDPAGQQLLQALRLTESGTQELQSLTDGLQQALPSAEHGSRPPRNRPNAQDSIGLSAFTAWVRDVLESSTFRDTGDATQGDVLVVPMAQLMGRAVAAVVVPGCDDQRLPPRSNGPGFWTAEQRVRLGLPSTESLTHLAHQAWLNALRAPALDVLWRTEEQGETRMPGPWVQALLVETAQPVQDPRPARMLQRLPAERPEPSAAGLVPEALSASAYQDLRDCPYRFFALRQLRLREADELEAEPDKRDMGIWLHAVLKAFHETRAEPSASDTPQQRERQDREALDQEAQLIAQRLGLLAISRHPDADTGVRDPSARAGFLPFWASWPALRDGYLSWLWGFEGTAYRVGPTFARAEVSLSRQLGPYRLVGQLDRIDAQGSPEGDIPFVMDYKTEPRETSLKRTKDPLEDTQIAFYAALLPEEETLRAAYVSISEQRDGTGQNAPTFLVEQEQVLQAREALVAGLLSDMDRVAAGHPLPALGEGRVCDFCAVRGLCRKDHWDLA